MGDIAGDEVAPTESFAPAYLPPETDTDDGTVTWDLAKNCVIGVHDEESGALTAFATISSGGRNVSATVTPEQIIDFAVRLIQFATNRRAPS